jgi:hypothetical protein
MSSWWDRDGSEVTGNEEDFPHSDANPNAETSPIESSAVAQEDVLRKDNNIVCCDICGGSNGFEWCHSCQDWCVCYCCEQCYDCVQSNANDPHEDGLEGPEYDDPDEEMEARAASFMLPKTKAKFHSATSDYRLEKYKARQKEEASANQALFSGAAAAYGGTQGGALLEYYEDEEEADSWYSRGEFPQQYTSAGAPRQAAEESGTQFVWYSRGEFPQQHTGTGAPRQAAKESGTQFVQQPDVSDITKIFDTDTCGICVNEFGMEGVVKVVCDPCGHVFCESCILTIRASNFHPIPLCPICRGEITRVFKYGNN